MQGPELVLLYNLRKKGKIFANKKLKRWLSLLNEVFGSHFLYYEASRKLRAKAKLINLMRWLFYWIFTVCCKRLENQAQRWTNSTPMIRNACLLHNYSLLKTFYNLLTIINHKSNIQNLKFSVVDVYIYINTLLFSSLIMNSYWTIIF